MDLDISLGTVLKHKQTKRIIVVLCASRMDGILDVKNVRDGVMWGLKRKYVHLYEKAELPEDINEEHIGRLILALRGFPVKKEHCEEFKNVLNLLKEHEK